MGVQLIGLASICDTHGPYQMIQSTINEKFRGFRGFIVIVSCSDSYISRFGDFCADTDGQPIAFTSCCACTCRTIKLMTLTYYVQAHTVKAV